MSHGTFGDYELLDPIASGGMGEVYRARQITLKRLVALKMILPGQLDSPDAVRRFHLEAEEAANLDHPNIVPIYEIGEHNGRHYFSMKLIEGTNLAAQVEKYRGSLSGAARRVAEVARIVHHAHRHGLLHRDLKPANILIDKQDKAHVTDFGLAKRVDAVEAEPAGSAPTDTPEGTTVVFRAEPATQRSGLTQAGAIVGTPGYVSPEQAQGRRNLTTATDVWSLGAILYELLTGRPPFQAATVMDTLVQVIEQPVEPPRSLNKNVDRNLNAICLKCLEKDPERRYRSAEALAEDLERWLDNKPIHARRWSWGEYGVYLVTEFWSAAMVLGIVLLGFIGFFVNDPLGQRRKGDDAKAFLKGLEEAKANRAKEDDRQRERERLLRYPHQIATAERELSANNPKRAAQILADCPASHRDAFEWRHLMARSKGAPSSRTFPPETGCLPLSDGDTYVFLARRDSRDPALLRLGFLEDPDGDKLSFDGRTVRHIVRGHQAFRWLAVVRDTGAITLWDHKADREHLSLAGHPGGTVAVAFAIGDEKLLSGGADGRVTVWNVATGKALRSFENVGTDVALEPEGRQFAACKDGAVLVYNGETGAVVHKLPVAARAVTFGWAGRRLAVVVRDAAGQDEVQIWDPGDKPKVEQTIRGHVGPVRALAFSPTGRGLVTAGEDGTVKLWPGPDPRLTVKEPAIELLTLRDAGANVTELLFRLDEKALVARRADGSVVLWETTVRNEAGK